MKRVIDGKVYDTEKAELLHEWDRGYSGDFNYVEEALYRTPKGAYFTAGSGGPTSIYARQTGTNEASGGSDIRVLDRDEAVQWLERHGGTDALLEHFADVLEEA